MRTGLDPQLDLGGGLLAVSAVSVEGLADDKATLEPLDIRLASTSDAVEDRHNPCSDRGRESCRCLGTVPMVRQHPASSPFDEARRILARIVHEMWRGESTR